MSSLDNRTLAIVGIVILIAVGLILFNPFNSNSNSSDNMSNRQIAVIETNFGNIVIQLFPDVAPGHVENFVKLAQDGFYDGSTFHRVIPGFMIQGGDPNSKDEDRSNDGQGGPGYTINAEFSDVPHKRGILSMARAQDPNSAGSQFFIVVADSNFLDGQYTVFGEVIEGMDVADKIVNVERDSMDNPLEKVTMKVTIRS
jgi:peptidyl-prolyl cis-trans isomerase B (cyclophilin B)